jgi:hypothetical protein
MHVAMEHGCFMFSGHIFLCFSLYELMSWQKWEEAAGPDLGTTC